LAFSELQGGPIGDRRIVSRSDPSKGWLAHMGAQRGEREVVGVCVVGRKLRRVREKLCAWVVGMLFGIRRTRTVEKGEGRKEERKERES
jgi:hypothetical protein